MIAIHGKPYVTVVERMDMMRQSGKTFEMVESMPVQVGERCVWRVAILLDGCKFYGSAECHFNAKAGTADATDPFACAETSAIGRALGFAGFGAVESIASADEIVRTQPQAPNPWYLKRKFQEMGYDLIQAQEMTFKGQPIKNIDDLTERECRELEKTYKRWKERFDTKQRRAS